MFRGPPGPVRETMISAVRDIGAPHDDGPLFGSSMRRASSEGNVSLSNGERRERYRARHKEEQTSVMSARIGRVTAARWLRSGRLGVRPLAGPEDPAWSRSLRGQSARERRRFGTDARSPPHTFCRQREMQIAPVNTAMTGGLMAPSVGPIKKPLGIEKWHFSHPIKTLIWQPVISTR
jgi:hypothetical protein